MPFFSYQDNTGGCFNRCSEGGKKPQLLPQKTTTAKIYLTILELFSTILRETSLALEIA
jgi:hypothetical protein